MAASNQADCSLYWPDCEGKDSGYKLIVVLSGLYNDLREQTQARLCKELTGVLEDPNGCDLTMKFIQDLGTILLNWEW